MGIWTQTAIFPKGVLGGVVAVVVIWLLIGLYSVWRVNEERRKLGLAVHGGAIAGGWGYLAHSPIVIVLLGIAFALGFYMSIRR
jgi:hypothetical protein